MKSIKQRLEEQYSFSKTDNIIKKVEMKPDKFLYETYKQYLNSSSAQSLSYQDYLSLVISEKNVERIINSRSKLPVPFLEYDEDGNIITHEGRHTVLALKKTGHKLVPVTIVKRR